MSVQTLASVSAVVLTGRAALSASYPANLAALRALWPALGGVTTNDKLALLNHTMVPGPPQDVARAELKKVVDGSGATLQAYVSNPPPGANPQAVLAANYLYALINYEASYDPTLRTSNATVFALVQQIGPDLLLDEATGVTQTMLDRMIALITPLVPWWQMHGFTGPVNVMDLVNAGNLS